MNKQKKILNKHYSLYFFIVLQSKSSAFISFRCLSCSNDAAIKTTDMKTQKTENLYKLIQKKTKGMYETRIARTIRFRLSKKQDLPTDEWQISIYKRDNNNIYLNEGNINDLTELKINEMVNVKDPFYSRKKEYEIDLKYFDKVAGEYYFVAHGDLDKAYKKYILTRIEMYKKDLQI